MATLFATATILYGSLWMYIVRHQAAPVELGLDSQYSGTNHWLESCYLRAREPNSQFLTFD